MKRNRKEYTIRALQAGNGVTIAHSSKYNPNDYNCDFCSAFGDAYGIQQHVLERHPDRIPPRRIRTERPIAPNTGPPLKDGHSSQAEEMKIPKVPAGPGPGSSHVGLISTCVICGRLYTNWISHCLVYHPTRDQVMREQAESATHVGQHPEYYGGGDNPLEAIKIIQHYGLSFELGSVLKYILRAGRKDPAKHIEDLEKCINYLNFEIGRVKKEQNENN